MTTRISRPDESQGFEYLVVVVLIVVLMSVALPNYAEHVRNSRTTEATARIGDIITSAKIYAEAHPDASGDPRWPSAAGGAVDLSPTTHFHYAITAGADGDAQKTPLTVTATGNADGDMKGVTVAISVPSIEAGSGPPIVTGL